MPTNDETKALVKSFCSENQVRMLALRASTKVEDKDFAGEYFYPDFVGYASENTPDKFIEMASAFFAAFPDYCRVRKYGEEQTPYIRMVNAIQRRVSDDFKNALRLELKETNSPRDEKVWSAAQSISEQLGLSAENTYKKLLAQLKKQKREDNEVEEDDSDE